MTARLHARHRVRQGGAIVEAALVLSLFVLFLFGIFEYSRLVFFKQLMDNAAREGARYAAINGSDPSLVTNTQNVVSTYMAGQDAPITSTVYLSDANGNNIGSASSATFGQTIAVQVNGTYTPAVGSLLKMGTISLQSRCLMCSEAN